MTAKLIALASVVISYCATAAIYHGATREHPRLTWLMIGAFLYSTEAVAWFQIYRTTRGQYADASAFYATVGAVFSVALAIATRQRQTPLEWAGFMLIIIGAVVRASGR